MDASTILLAVGIWLAAEGLVLALFPQWVDDILDLIRRMPAESRRTIGLGAALAGTVLIWLAVRGAA